MVKDSKIRIQISIDKKVLDTYKAFMPKYYPHLTLSEIIEDFFEFEIRYFNQKEHDVGSDPSKIPRGSGEAASGHVD